MLNSESSTKDVSSEGGGGGGGGVSGTVYGP